MANPFASFAAGSGGDNNGGWLSTRKSRDEIKKSADAAREARKSKNSRGKKTNNNNTDKKGSKGGGQRGANKKQKGKSRDDSWMAESSEEEEDFIIEETEDEGEWDGEESSEEEVEYSEGDDEGSDDDYQRKKKSTNKKAKAAAVRSDIRNKRNAARNKNAKNPIINLDDDTTDDEGKGVDTSMDDIFDEDEKELVVRNNKEKKKKGNDTKKSPYFSSGFDEKKEDDDDDDVASKSDESDMMDDNDVSRSKVTNKRRMIFSDESSDDDMSVKKQSSTKMGKRPKASSLDDDDEDVLADTPAKAKGQYQSFSDDDFVDDEEAKAIEKAMKDSIKDQKKRKRLKKMGGRGDSLASLDRKEQKQKKKIVYKDDLEDDESIIDVDNDDEEGQDEDEDDVFEVVNEEEHTAAEVLKEANALSAKIVKIVSEWCGGDGGKVKGLILGESDGALNLGSGDGGEAKNGGDKTWISKETMKQVLPNVELAEYQLLGVNWMALLNRTTFGSTGSKKTTDGGDMGVAVNGILADEMGLGKTVQTIAFLAWLNQQRNGKVISLRDDEKNSSNGNADDSGLDDSEDDDDTPTHTASIQRPHLIVVPASVLSNWMNEFKKFAPKMKVMKYHGSQKEREQIQDDLGPYLKGMQKLDVVLTTYSYFSSENKADRSFLRKFQFDYMVVDEGHTLKNPKGLRYKNLNKFKTKHRLLLTGTPCQNNAKELMSLLCFLMPLFDRKKKASKKRRGHDDDDDDDGGERMLEYFVQIEGRGGGNDGDAKAYRKLKQLFAPFVLRRKKDDVLSQIMPPKKREVELVPMETSARLIYDNILSSHLKARQNNAAARQHLFTALRKAANHPLLLRTRHIAESEKHDLAQMLMNYGYFGNDASLTLGLVKEELDKFSDYDIHCACEEMISENSARRQLLGKYTLLQDDLFSSSKFVRLRHLLPDLIKKGHRMLIFSQWTKVLDLMLNLLESLELSCLRLDGSTPVSERQALIDKFNNDQSIPVFLLSTRAGGMGLNLTAADVCILHDLDFNPFNDLQAEDRCHRIGQTKPVTIIKMVTQGTVDEDIYSIQERKARMNKAIMEENGKKKSKKESEELCAIALNAVENFKRSKEDDETEAIDLTST
eukprot:CAMPEP_0113411986 /NCGR_PEP_ID=MMETSP0013_2-20120614/22582_1 /TAXON_ID=2843 ORGANISM="Skeletonema costatum, Strain 1716" /NCGR_SAMPLE_ID=MMETSP0013_2 /ASSEMBLY_ACC=CAM_ASM_000158 /LENGTH=1115 /DNA_ID=CAMNT_0000298425 /DNA_START=26 /DNA_END=3373 /DNA_ORIENTATION=+ /assembly_acc=CAM_ASM_000158